MFFVDFEASSLLPGSYPIEVAWVDADGRGDAYLILPHADWLRRGIWSPESEAIHGISLATLLAEGHPIPFVADRLIASRKGHTVFSDAPDHDGRWLDRLLEYADRSERISIEPVQEAYGVECRQLLHPQAGHSERVLASEMCAAFVAAAEIEFGDQSKVRHRALADAVSLWRTWKSVRDQVDAWLPENG